MTLSEIAVALERPKQGGRGGNMSGEEIAERIEAWKKLTPREKLLSHGRRD